MIEYNFYELEEFIAKKIEDRLKETPIENEDGFTLIEGIMSLNTSLEVSANLHQKWSYLPLVGIVGKRSGQIYMFALKHLLNNGESND